MGGGDSGAGGADEIEGVVAVGGGAGEMGDNVAAGDEPGVVGGVVGKADVMASEVDGKVDGVDCAIDEMD